MLQNNLTSMTERNGDKIHIKGDYQYTARTKGPAPQRFWHHNKLKRAVSLIDINFKTKILDAGCGSGLLIGYLLKAGFTDITAVDINRDAIMFAKNKYQHPRVTYKIGALNHMCLPKQTFDTIFFLEVIEHLTITQAKKTLQYFNSLLKPGGKIIISTPNKKSCWPLIEKTLDLFKLVPTLSEAQHEHLYTKNELQAITKNANLSTPNIQTINGIAPWAALVNWRLAEYIDIMEHKNNINWGSLLIGSFQKK